MRRAGLADPIVWSLLASLALVACAQGKAVTPAVEPAASPTATPSAAQAPAVAAPAEPASPGALRPPAPPEPGSYPPGYHCHFMPQGKKFCHGGFD